ncbi:MAG: dTMP kinase [Ignavibacteriota bacterium]
MSGFCRHSPRGEIVLSDRFTDSSLVYQGAGRDLGADAVSALERIACRGLKPHLTILVDVDAEASLARARAPQRRCSPS